MFAKCAAAAATCLIAAVMPAQASSACRTHAEARQMFRTSYLYWHGKDHCWDASAVVTRHASLTRRIRHQRRPPGAAVAPKPSHENATVGLSATVRLSSPSANSGELPPASGLTGLRRPWPNTMAMAETIETTPWINRWPDQPIKPPSRPALAQAAADAAIVNPRGMVAGIMALVLSLALLEVLFGGSKLRTRLMFGRKNPAPSSNWAEARRVVPKTWSSLSNRGDLSRARLGSDVMPSRAAVDTS
jgi:hypothetical protein